MDSHRRVFRGRGGPTDRRLPKYNARRRKVPREKLEHSNVDVNNNDVEEVVAVVTSDVTSATTTTTEQRNEAENDIQLLPIIIYEVEPHRMLDVSAVHNNQEQQSPPQNIVMPCDLMDQQQVNDADQTIRINKCHKEIRHLLQRIQHIRESISLSPKAISDHQKYEQNVLNAASNCINEWRSIVTHYNTDDSIPISNNDTQSMFKKASLKIFELIQQALQCGPLAGSKPGYFKRCGGSIARLVLKFLDSAVPNQLAAQRLGFSSKQADVVEKWKANARKAMDRA